MIITTPDELLNHLCAMGTLTRDQAKRAVAEVLAFYDESVEDYIQQRHRDLQGQGLSNSQIFTLVAKEIKQRRFPAAALTERQIRRIIYG